jgi:hypothetical protein
MADLTALKTALLAKKGQDYFAELEAFANELVDRTLDNGAALMDAVTSTSVTSIAIGTGTKTITVAADKKFVLGMPITVAYDAANLMYGTVVSYNAVTGQLQFLVDDAEDTKGAGTYAAWTVSLKGDEGDQGPAWYANAGTKTANYQIASGESIVANTAGGAFDVTTPNGGAFVANVTRFRTIKIGGSQLNIIRGTGGVTLNGQADDAYIPADKVGVLEAVATSTTDLRLIFTPATA